MTTEHEFDRSRIHTFEPAFDTSDVEPNRATPSSQLVSPPQPWTSGILHRKTARDGNGVAEGAEDAVAAASASSGMSLPTTLMRKFESSLGADLSGVRVHTGAASQAAAETVGARAYTIGNDIHFGAGQFDMSAQAGEHLLAHEVAHTVQQAGSTPTRQNKLEVSSPADHAEHEADHAADAMVAGRSANVTMSSGVARKLWREPAQQQQQQTAAAQTTAPVAPRDPSALVTSLAFAYQTMMERQLAGLDNLMNDYAKVDDPSIADTALQAAVVYGLTGVIGLLFSPIAAAAVDAVSTKLMASAASKAISVGEQEMTLFLAEYKNKTLHYATKVNSAVSSTLQAGARQFFKNGALEPFRCFFETQRDALLQTKSETQQRVISSVGEFGGQGGYDMAAAMLEAVNAQMARATDTQYMSSLSQWSKVATGKITGSLTITLSTLGTGSAALAMSSVKFAGNDAIRNRLRLNSTIKDRKLSEFPLPLTVHVSGPSHWMAQGVTNAVPSKYPQSGEGAYDLYRFATGKELKSGQANDTPIEAGCNAGAAMLFNKIGQMTWASLPELG